MSDPVLLKSRQDATLELRLNRPQSKNSLDEALVDELGQSLEAASADPALRVIVLSGAGGAFCSGVDLRSAAAELDDRARLEGRLAGFHRVIRAIAGAPQPVIASVDGPAVGFGADLAYACDLRVASTRAYFEEKFVAIGLMPDGGGTFHLPRLIGLGRALEHQLLGTRFDAERALALGLVSRVVAPEELGAETNRVSTQLALAAPLAVRAIKRALRESADGTLDDALERERRGQLGLLASADAREGVSAFLGRRAPAFSGS
ncbi:MAG TPA: enoyl-CoA hydratase-related protein [Polyangiaceae bacterium]|nr:enoyl-CoA hydratase-related protein [Polyangiaceae bacterium]